MTIPFRLWERLRNRRYRRAFVATQVKRGLPFQIRAMRKKLKLTQQELADRAGLPQGSISRAEDLNYGKLTINTLLAIANGFDAALLVRFVPFSQLAHWFSDLSEESVQVETFDEEDTKIHQGASLPSEQLKPRTLHTRLVPDWSPGHVQWRKVLLGHGGVPMEERRQSITIH